jgi:hypothetical protein
LEWRGDIPYLIAYCRLRQDERTFRLERIIPKLKAISQNLMHSSLTITDGVYGVLSGQDVGGQ